MMMMKIKRKKTPRIRNRKEFKTKCDDLSCESLKADGFPATGWPRQGRHPLKVFLFSLSLSLSLSLTLRLFSFIRIWFRLFLWRGSTGFFTEFLFGLAPLKGSVWFNGIEPNSVTAIMKKQNKRRSISTMANKKNLKTAWRSVFLLYIFESNTLRVEMKTCCGPRLVPSTKAAGADRIILVLIHFSINVYMYIFFQFSVSRVELSRFFVITRQNPSQHF